MGGCVAKYYSKLFWLKRVVTLKKSSHIQKPVYRMKEDPREYNLKVYLCVAKRSQDFALSIAKWESPFTEMFEK